eukprot:jgi/Antlo1/1262/2408
MKSPMDVEMELHWKRKEAQRKERVGQLKELPYTSSLKKRKVEIQEDIDSSALVQLVPPPNLNTRWRVLSAIPYMGIGYLHFVLNFVVVFLLVYASVALALFIRSDIRSRIDERKTILKNLIEESRKNYEMNRCDPRTRVPAMSGKCAEWEATMNRSLSSVELTKIVVEVFGEACDGFVEKASVKSCFICAVFFVLFLLFRNSRIGMR